ncbi:haloacid dehalogenase, type II [Streptomyces sp. CS113]|uniref:haloacid dehalogenase type II n=1 Tax=Streptomyces sp. CS113 TaxID=1982761 RepID=UPI000B41473B|nr:haloacid dehalogenase type II [Streptomyces sp. CS113]OWA11829.1 haloacid dehalogenase, type II [Streptomyces sp. CS113]
MTSSVRALVFDVNETLSDLNGLGPRLEEVGASPGLVAEWFAGVLRDGFALTAAGGYAEFTQVAAERLRVMLEERLDHTRDAHTDAQYVVEGIPGLPTHDDVCEGIRELYEAGLPLFAMTNGSAASAETFLRGAGLLDRFRAVLSVEEPRVWKPARAAYQYAAHRMGYKVQELMMVSVHPWDIDGARRAGLSTAWLRRAAPAYPEFLGVPDLIVQALPHLAALLPRQE